MMQIYAKMAFVTIITWSLDGFARLVAGLEQAYSIPGYCKDIMDIVSILHGLYEYCMVLLIIFAQQI